MKLYILTRKKIAIMGFCVIALALTVIISIQGITVATNASAQNKKIPIYCVDREEKVVSISFDAAWGNEQTGELLDILDKYNIKTTFFLVGQWVDKYPDSVKDISNRGHDVSNHSNTHPHMTKLSNEKMVEEIESCNKKIQDLTGKKPILFRPPYGDYNNAVVDAVNSTNMYCIQWDVDSLDWKDPSPDDMVKRIKSKMKPGSIILLHNGAKNTPAALPKIIETITAEGYQIVPISQIIHQGSYTTDNEGKQHKCT